MSKLFKAIFFCCITTEETKEVIEHVEKNSEFKKTNDKASADVEDKSPHRAHSEENPEINKDLDSSESCSISSGGN
ncbi:hypothetical protein SteCoe_24495 [Stentor coeruleus]|uniref:Uncharacterized protein n=1 Tax=Stentor coeruleus TaxID=5963 RepID=A0A1R2BHI6_9CILI|nr:hypothetical protein SteCoe_24495 [Stentor coeruleus]